MAAAGGGGNPIMAAMQRRGMAGGVTNQVGPGSPTFANAVQPPQIGAAPPAGMPPMGGQPPQPAPQAQGMQQQGMALTNPEAKIIVSAMRERLASISKQEEAGFAPPGMNA